MGLKSKLKSKWLWVALIVAAGSIVLFSLLGGGTEAEVYQVSRGKVSQKVEDTGEVLPLNEQTVYLEGTGKVKDIKVKVGSSVKEGDVLLILESSELELELKDAEAKIQAAQAQLESTELKNYAQEIELAKAKLTQAEIAFNSAARDYEKAQQLYAAFAISEADWAKAKDAYEMAKASLEAAKLQLKEAQQGPPDYLIRSYQSQLEQANLAKAHVLAKMEKQVLRAPFAGVVLEQLVDENTLITPATPAFIIGNMDELEVKADILADEVHKLKVGNQVEVTGPAVNEQVILGQVTEIAPRAKTVTSSLGVTQKRVPVTITLKDQSAYLRPGYNVDVRIITAEREQVLLVPDTAIFEYEGKEQVFVVEKGKAVLREVVKGLEGDSFVEIKDGLQEGEIILAKPDNNIREGLKIKPKALQGSDFTVQ